jgi:hypothetical protein
MNLNYGEYIIVPNSLCQWASSALQQILAVKSKMKAAIAIKPGFSEAETTQNPTETASEMHVFSSLLYLLCCGQD